MRLLYVGDTRSPHFRAWPLHFLNLGHEVHVCHLAREDPVTIEGAVCHPPLRAIRAGVRGAWRLSALELRRLAHRVRPNVVHSHQVVPAGYLAAAARVVPHVATAWGSEVLLATGRQLRLVGRVARSADLLTADSRHLLEALSARGAPAPRLRLVPWGIDPRWCRSAASVAREDAARHTGLPDDRPIVLSHRGTSGIFRPQAILHALALARAEVPSLLGVVLYDAKADAVPLDDLTSAAERLGLARNVVFRPKVPHDRMPLWYRASSVCVSVPESDSAPTSVIEALALGVPVVVSDLPWVHEPVYREARVGVVPVGDADRLADEIVARLLEPNSGDVDCNRRLVLEHFDRERLFERVGYEYERLAGGRASERGRR